MTTSLILALIWLVVANLLAIVPSNDNHWRRAYILIALGLPLLGWLIYESGPWVGLACLLAAGSLLRWPVRYLGRYLARWVRQKLSPSKTAE